MMQSARSARGMGDFVGYDFVANPVCPFCGEQWEARSHAAILTRSLRVGGERWLSVGRS